VSICQTLHF